jgi:hypothetical protein
VARVTTRDAMVVLWAGDNLAPAWLAVSARVLARRPDVAFAGTWLSYAGGVLPSTLDIMPEAYPFEHGTALTRTLMRTVPDRPLLDVFDPDLGALGEIGYLWRVVAERGHGCLLPRPLIEIAESPAGMLDRHLLSFLVLRYGGPFADRLALLTPVLEEARRAAIEPGAAGRMYPVVSFEEKVRLANELGGRRLARMAIGRITRRFGRVPS